MSNPFPDWIAQLAKDGLGPLEMPAITRGQAHAVTLSFGEDYSGDTFTMALKSAPDASTALATMACTTGSFDGTNTPIEITLAAGAQGSLPADTDANGVEVLVYDIIHNPASGEPYRIIGGYQPVSGAVT